MHINYRLCIDMNSTTIEVLISLFFSIYKFLLHLKFYVVRE
jgi:hypothetical protein